MFTIRPLLPFLTRAQRPVGKNVVAAANASLNRMIRQDTEQGRPDWVIFILEYITESYMIPVWTNPRLIKPQSRTSGVY